MNPEIRQISKTMSLRTPQEEALCILSKAAECIQKGELQTIVLQHIQQEFPHFLDFERAFPNFCFELATGVGKTKLMGAMILYLALVKGIRDFVILAPNSTVLEKIEREFSQPNHPKYIFRGVPEFANRPPKIITGENFDEGYGVRSEWAQQSDFLNGEDVHIYIFNIAMIHSDKRRMKSPRETIVGGMSYFQYLSQIENLVIFMDEAHHFRAPSASKAVSELKPWLGIELTATAQIETGSRSLKFRNILYQYPLSSALRDGYVKEPWVAGRENFKKSQLTDEALERLKLEDGVRIHENTKAHLQNYGFSQGQHPVKPLILIIAEDMEHANRLESLMKSDDFFEGQYKAKIRVVHSGVKPEEEERMVRDLLEVESFLNPIEIVIHVNMLKEGWDVVNLYTIVPLRAANSKTLIEQSLGRGLRLPFGKRTGVAEIDRLTIVSHDRFDDLIAEAKRPDSLIRSGIVIGRDMPMEGVQRIEIKPAIVEEIESYSELKKFVAQKTLERMQQMPTQDAAAIAEEIAKDVEDQDQKNSVKRMVLDFQERCNELSIQIPKIYVEPEILEPGKYLPFKLNLQHIRLQPMGDSIVRESLESGKQEKMNTLSPIHLNQSSEEYLVDALLQCDAIPDTEENYEIAEMLCRQVMEHLASYLFSKKDIENVLRNYGPLLVNSIRTQMSDHCELPKDHLVSRMEPGFTFLKSTFIGVPKNSFLTRYDETISDKNQISSHVFTGFTKSIYSAVKFDSDSERIFAVILERDIGVLKWVKPPLNSLSLYHSQERRYEPDFIVEIPDGMFMCEIKSDTQMTDPIVEQKRKAAVLWCEQATMHAAQHRAKPWTYLLIPHNDVCLNTTFSSYLKRFRK